MPACHILLSAMIGINRSGNRGYRMPDRPLVSCLCVTQNRVPLLRRSVACFLRQTYEPRELVVVHATNDAATRAYLATLSGSTIRGMEVLSAPQLTLGKLRNLSVQAARGHYVAHWDDDDWHASTRLAEQIDAIEKTGKSACVLWRVVLFDMLTGSAFLSKDRAWEGTLVAERSALPAYAEARQGEDTPVIDQLLQGKKLTALDRPQLFVYVYHGGNTWKRKHWEENLFAFAQPLSGAETARVKAALEL